MRRKWYQESGAMIVEASVVFPVSFLVIFLMIFTGNAYLQKCKVESLVTQMAIAGAAYCVDPMLDEVENSEIPEYDEADIRLYRYLIGSEMDDIVDEIEQSIQDSVSGMSTGLFSGMVPAVVDVDVEFDNGFLYSTFSVELQYKIVMPIRLLGESDNIVMNLSSHAEVSASDSVQLIRNIDMVEDYAEQFEVTNSVKEKIQEAIAKVKEWVSE